MKINFLLLSFIFAILLSSVNAAWLSGWSYRRPITISNTQNSNTLSDYQVLVTLDTASLISASK
ncbi:MAG: hypothetical protein ACP5HJ_03840, partial [Candidatus Micrarchaeia archaeon]